MQGWRRKPWWRQDVGAALAFKEEGEPEGKRGAVGRVEGWYWSLNRGRRLAIV